jgi:uncharacterized membrane protein YgcG
MSPRPWLATVLAALVALLILSTAVSAQSLTGDQRVVDETGVITDDQRTEALDAITALDESRNVQLWALFVGTTNGQAVADYATQVAAENGLGGNDALFVVAVDDRRDSLWVGDLLDAVSNDEIDSLLANEAEPRLADGNWGAAIAAVADGLDAALADGAEQPEPQEPEPGTGGPSQPSGDGGDNPLPLLIALALVAGGAWLIWSWFRDRRAVAAEDRERTGRLTRLARDANRLLIETDELLRHDQQELGFAEAEFGKEAAEPFRVALAAARQELQAAFRARQQLDDNEPEAPPEREQLLNEIIARCTRAHELVEQQTERFRQLRDLERRAPEVLAESERRAAAVEARLPAAEQTLVTLQAEAPGSSRAVHGNVAEARKRLEIASRSAAQGRAALEGADRAAAGRAAKASMDALNQARTLLDAIEREAAALDEARAGVDGALAQARTDVAAAADAVARTPDTDQRDELAAAQSKLQAAEAAAGGAERDAVHAYRLAREAEAAADQVVARVREGEEQRARQRAAVDAAMRAAELQLDRAEEFIGTRRHGVGRRPRTALSEADAALARARLQRDSDPAAAVAEARRAGELADDAYRRAQLDFGAADQAGYGGTVVINGRPYGMGRDNGWGGDVGGAIIGGIIGSILSGGGRRGGGGFGGFGGGGFGGFGGGGFGGCGGGLGGGGRSFGGGFGGGGGRARGGGW